MLLSTYNEMANYKMIMQTVLGKIVLLFTYLKGKIEFWHPFTFWVDLDDATPTPTTPIFES